jgi:hypothetical protein
MTTTQATVPVNGMGSPQPVQRRKRNKGQFKRGDPRINRNGRPAGRPKADARVRVHESDLRTFLRSFGIRALEESWITVVACKFNATEDTWMIDVALTQRTSCCRLPVVLPGEKLPILDPSR